MSRTTLRTKWISGILSALLLLNLVAPVSKAAKSQQTHINETASTVSNLAPDTINVQRYSDVPDHAWYAEAVNDWITRGILTPKQGDKFQPQFDMTRGDFAYLLTYSLGLAPSVKSGAFKDVPESELAGYISALKEAGLAQGYPDGTFRPDLPVTRAEVASWIAAAKKLTLKPQTSSPFRDVPPTSWYSGAVDVLASMGIVSGKTKDRFAPGDVITRAETINLLYSTFYKSYLIQDIQDDGTIIIDGHAYRSGDSVKGIFQPSNLAALHNAAIQFTHHGDTIVSVENLHIGYKDALAGKHESLVFNAQGNTINGVLIVDADQLALAHVEVKGDLLLTSAIQTNFFGYDVLVLGDAVYLEDTGTPKSQIANLEFQQSDLGKLVLENSANVKQVQLVPDSMSKSSLNPQNEVRVLAADLGSLFCDCSVVKVPGLRSTPISPSSPSLSPGLYVQVIDGLIHVSNPGGSSNFSAGQFGYTPSFVHPPILLPSNPGLKFQPPPVFKPTTSIKENPSNDIDKDPLKLKCDNVSCNVETFVRSQLDTSSTGSIGTVTVHSGANLQYLGIAPIDKLFIGDLNATKDAIFTGSANIKQVTVKGNGDAKAVLNLQGTIGTLETTGSSPVVLSGSTTINNLIVPSGVNPNSVFANANDLSKVSAINGQSTVQVTTPPVVTPPSDTTPPNGLSAPMTVVQKDGSTIETTVTISDEDAAAQGVTHYRVFVAIGANATTSDPYQEVSVTGAVYLNLDALTSGFIAPSDGQEVYFTVVAYDAGGNASVPTDNDKVNVTWNMFGHPTGVNALTVEQIDQTHASLTFTDQDRVTQDIVYYKVFVAIGSDTAHQFQTDVTAINIDLSPFSSPGGPVNGVVVHFTVVAVNSDNVDSIPTHTDTVTVVW